MNVQNSILVDVCVCVCVCVLLAAGYDLLNAAVLCNQRQCSLAQLLPDYMICIYPLLGRNCTDDLFCLSFHMCNVLYFIHNN